MTPRILKMAHNKSGRTDFVLDRQSAEYYHGLYGQIPEGDQVFVRIVRVFAEGYDAGTSDGLRDGGLSARMTDLMWAYYLLSEAKEAGWVKE